jgi:hypothetical protein
VVGREHKRDKRRHDRRGDRVTEHRRQREAGAVRSRFRQRLPAGAENHFSSDERAGRGLDAEAVAVALDERHLRRIQKRRAGRPGFPEERVEDRTGRIRLREELAGVGLPVERDPEGGEEGDGLLDGKPAEDLADRRRRAAGEVALVDPPMGDVAAAPPRDNDFCPQLPGSVDANDGRRSPRGRLSPPGPGRGKQSGSPDSDHGDVGLRRNPGGLEGVRLRGGFAG